MLRRVGVLVVRRPKMILAAVAVLFAIGIVFGGAVSEKLGVRGFVDPMSESTQVAEFLDQNVGTTPNLVLEVVARDGQVTDPDVMSAADRVRQLVEAEPAAKVIGSFSQDTGADLKSKDGRSGLVVVHVGGITDEAAKVASRIVASLPTDDTNVTVRAGGTLGVQDEIERRVSHDLLISESIALPISLGVLVIVFGGLIAAFLPVVVGATSIVTTLLVLLVMSFVTDVSVHALTVATAFGLGLSIDFGLLMVSRFREERAKGLDHQSAVVETVATAGRTIIFSAATVTLAMSGLLVFPLYFLRSVGLAASAVVVLSALSAIVVLPALLALLGNRIDSLAVVRRKAPLSADSVFWRRCAQAVTRRPLLTALPVIATLLALGIPFLSVQFATPDERALPSDSSARLVTESLRDNYAIDTSQSITLLARPNADALNDLAGPASLMDGVLRVDVPAGSYAQGQPIAARTSAGEQSGAAYGFVYLAVDAESDAAQDITRTIRAMIVDHQVQVGGPTATLIDSRAAIADRLPVAILVIAVATFVLLFLFTGSVVVPVKALVLNLLVLSAVLGAMVWIFQDGHLTSVLGITPAPLNLAMVVLLCCIAFSLSVDYEIFLLSRIKEARDAGLPNNDAVVVGLGRVGRIISSAAILLTITLVSFANGLAFMKMFGIGTTLAVVLDATVIRGVVVPAFLRVAGDFNWWAPRPLKWLHSRIGFSEAAPAISPAQAPESSQLVVVQAAEPKTVKFSMPAIAAYKVEIVPGRHLVANDNGTVIVVAHRETAPLSAQSVAARRMSDLVAIVRRTEGRRLARAASQLITSHSQVVDFAIVKASPAGLDIVLCGAVSVVLDSGAGLTWLHGPAAPRLLHRTVPAPAVAASVTVDDADERLHARPHRTGVYALAAGTVPGRGAVICSNDAALARKPASGPAGSDMCTAPTVQIRRPLGYISRIETERDCVIGGAPHDSGTAQRGLRPAPAMQRRPRGNPGIRSAVVQRHPRVGQRQVFDDPRPGLPARDPVRPRVDVHRVAAQERHQGEPGLAGQIDRQR